MDAAEIIELSDLNLAESHREMTRRAGGVVHDEDGLLFWVGVHPMPVVLSGVLPTGRNLDPVSVLRRAETFFGARGRGYTLTLRAHRDEAIEVAAAASDLHAWSGSPAMVLRDRLPDSGPGDGVSLERVESETQAAEFAGVMADAYGSLGMPGDVAPAALTREVLQAPHIVSFLARLEDGTPAAGATMILTHTVAGIYWVGTIEAARTRGLAEVVTRAAGNAGFDLGARIASLQASKMGEPVYRRMGYRTVTQYPAFVKFVGPL